jgi:hypothetical protein
VNLNNTTYISFYLRSGRIHVFCAAVRAIGEPPFVRFRLNGDGTSMIMEAYDKKEFQSMCVPKTVYNKTGQMEFNSIGFCKLLADRLSWDQSHSYRIPGKILSKQNLVLFDLANTIVINPHSLIQQQSLAKH